MAVAIPVRADGLFGWFGLGTPTSLTWLDARGASQRCSTIALPADEKGFPKALVPWSCVVGSFPINPTNAVTVTPTTAAR